LRIFIPTFWLVFFGLFTIAAWVVSPESAGMLGRLDFRLGVTSFFLTGAAMLYFTLLKLKRVEMDAEQVFATNYFKSVRYPWSNVDRIVRQPFLVFHIMYIHLKKPGYFGSRIVFLASRSRWKLFVDEFPPAGELVKEV
jgi:hypothetical protein